MHNSFIASRDSLYYKEQSNETAIILNLIGRRTCLIINSFMNTLKKKIGLSGLLYFAPLFAFAQVATTDVSDILTTIGGVLNAVIPLIIGLAFVVFLWGIYKYVSAASGEGKEGARETIIYGVIGLFVMLAAWGLVNVLLNTFNLDTATPTGLPNIPSRTITP